jgi:cytochrome c-type biogenesis protein CcmH
VGRRSDALAAYDHAKSLGNSHAELEKMLGAFGSISGEVAEDPTPAIHGRLTLSPEVAIQVRQGDTVFIFAKESTEHRMPVAALRKSVADLPLEFVLSDDQTMVPGTHLADYEHLVVTARVSRSGKAGDTLSDFETTSAPVSPSNGDDIELLITTNVTIQGSINE